MLVLLDPDTGKPRRETSIGVSGVSLFIFGETCA
jgi:hypothetical protein